MIRIIRDPAELDSLSSGWNVVADIFKSPLLRHEWFSACAKTLCNKGDLLVLVNTHGERITAIAPLALTRRLGMTTIELLGCSALDEPSGFLYQNGGALQEVLHHMIELKKPVLLGRLNSESSEAAMIQETGRRGFFTNLKSRGGSPVLPITGSWKEYEAAMSPRHRYDLRRARKRSERLGAVFFEVLSPEPGRLDHYLGELFRVEDAGWKGRSRTSLQRDLRLKRFFRTYAEAALRLGTLRLCFLRINDQPAAAMLCIEQYNRFWILKIGYDEAFSKCSPGVLLMHETIRYAFEHGLEAYEFLGSDAPWIRMWTRETHSHMVARLYPYSLSGQFGRGMDIISSAVRRTAKIVNA